MLRVPIMGEREGVLGVKIGLRFLNPPRFLRQELLTPFPGELSLTFVLGLRGSKRRLGTSQESTSDRLGRAPQGLRPSGERLMFVRRWQVRSGVWRWEAGGGSGGVRRPVAQARASWTRLHFQGPANESRGNGVCAGTGQPKSTTLNYERIAAAY